MDPLRWTLLNALRAKVYKPIKTNSVVSDGIGHDEDKDKFDGLCWTRGV